MGTSGWDETDEESLSWLKALLTPSDPEVCEPGSGSDRKWAADKPMDTQPQLETISCIVSPLNHVRMGGGREGGGKTMLQMT